jgi:hypothetical protein
MLLQCVWYIDGALVQIPGYFIGLLLRISLASISDVSLATLGDVSL